MRFEVGITSKTTAESNMAWDVDKLNSLKVDSRAILHFYQWEKPSATYGYFIDPIHYLDQGQVRSRGLDLARRPTGGGIIFHHCDLAFSFLLPADHPRYSINPLDNYAFVNEAIITALHEFKGLSSTLLKSKPTVKDQTTENFCLALPTQFDVMIEGRKVAGGAQRRTKHGFLHQGSIVLTLPSEDFLTDLVSKTVVRSIHDNSVPLLDHQIPEKELQEAKAELKLLLIKAFKKSI